MTEHQNHGPQSIGLKAQFEHLRERNRNGDGEPLMFVIGTALGAIFFSALGAGGFFDGFIIKGYYGFSGDVGATRLLIVCASGLFGFALGWFATPDAGPLRAFGIGMVLSFLGYVMIVDQGFMGWGVATVTAWVAFFVGLGFWARKFVKRLAQTPTTLGSAAWATLSELFRYNIIGEIGLRLGYFDADTGFAPLHYDGDRHGLVIAPNRSGKGTCTIIPNLLTYEGSVLVIDPKGENAMITAKHRAESMDQNVHVVDPWNITSLNTSRFNPLDWLVKGDVDIADNAMLLADAIIVAMGENEQFWTEEAKALLLGVILLVALDDHYEGYRNLGTVRDLLCSDGNELTELFKRMLQCPHPVVRSTGARCLQKEEKLLSNVMASVQAQTHFLDSQRLRESLSQSDFDFADLKDKKMSIYLVLPADRLNSHGRWLRLLIQQAITVNARNIEKKPKKPVLFILDEMPALGKLTMVEQAFGLMAGFGLQILGIVQDASQLKRIYGDGWETFVSNAGVIQYFGSRDKMTAEYFSSLCGVTTVWNFSTAVARAVGVTHSSSATGASSSTSKTTTTTDTATGTQRRLAYADELMRMGDDQQLLLIKNMNPIMGQKQPWFKNPELKELGINLYADQSDNTDCSTTE